MKCLEENALKKLISLFKGDLNEKADIDLCNVIPGEKAWIEGSLPSSAYWSSICYGDDKFVAVASGSNKFAYSADGITWTEGTLPSSDQWSSICYGNGKFVTVTYSNNYKLAYSTDGIKWYQKTTLPTGNPWARVYYGGGKYIITSSVSDNRIAYSTDGLNWTESTLPSVTLLKSVCYGNDKFVALTHTGKTCLYSTDGITWKSSNQMSSMDESWQSVCYGNGKFVAISSYSSDSTGKCVYSEDGINWTATTLPYSSDAGDNSWKSVCYGDNKFMAITSSSNIAACSEDGINWIKLIMSDAKKWDSICYGSGNFVVIPSGNANTIARYSRSIFFTTMDDNYLSKKNVDSSLSSASTNPVQNKVVNDALNEKAPAYTYSTTDLTPGTSYLETGKLYIVYK